MAEFCFDRARQHVPSIRSHVKSRETCARAPLHPEGITGECVYPSSHRIRFSIFFFPFSFFLLTELSCCIISIHWEKYRPIRAQSHLLPVCVFISIQAILQGT
jgi:hypothetical protein